ncbi:MAG: aminotransferase class I/II-fold pyridoxal phosphate-dependent enzyme [Actinomycetota bacterium]|nr:aminotransferase class I/II-fold pyridoxal phosphate-dependent enzyme [Actinomycetota bacterium]
MSTEVEAEQRTTERVIGHRAEAILSSVRGFISAISDPETGAALGDPYACDFVAGNPQEIAPRGYVDVLLRWTEPQDKSWFGYKGAHRPAQVAAAEALSKELGINFDPDDVALTRGAHGALAAALATVVDPGDEVIYLSPPWFFYEAMILAADATPVKVKVEPATFDLDVEAIEHAVTERTRVVLINTPNNPTGRIYPGQTLQALGELLEAASARSGRPIYILSDESYSRILFDGNRMVSPSSFYPRTLLVHTYSKSALAPGQRLGYLAFPPAMPGREELRLGLLGVGLGTANLLPDAIMQYALADIDAIPVDTAALQRKRDRMVHALQGMGYEVRVPEATFYLLPRSPLADDVEFTRRLRRDKVLVLPGRTFDMPGYFRISLTATNEMIERALPVFEQAMIDASALIDRD